jgi:succinate dehydrogenase/fumarate reductase flavoprotein subunit
MARTGSGSNSLTELLVFGPRAALSAMEYVGAPDRRHRATRRVSRSARPRRDACAS